MLSGSLADHRVAAELVGGGCSSSLMTDRGLLGFEEELARAADLKAVVGGLDGAADADGILVDDILVGFGVALFVVDVPAEGFEQGIKKLLPKPRFIVVPGFVGLELFPEPRDQYRKFPGARP